MVKQTAYNSLRQHAPRLALALLFQPERQKATLSTLLLLGLEFDRIAAQVSEPMLAMIRLQWWQAQLDTDNASAGPLAAHLKNQLIALQILHHYFHFQIKVVLSTLISFVLRH